MNYKGSSMYVVGVLSCVLVVLVGIFSIKSYTNTHSLKLVQGKRYQLGAQFLPVTYNMQGKDDVKDSKASIKTSLNSKSIAFDQTGFFKMDIFLLGIIPLKKMELQVIRRPQILAVGKTVGIRLKVDGVMVSAIAEVQTNSSWDRSPGKNAGLRPGDIIFKMNQIRVDYAHQMLEILEKNSGKELEIQYYRGNTQRTTTIQPIMSSGDNRYHLGLWCRDYMAGIGTVTFIDENKTVFGALGHGVSHDSGEDMIRIKDGELVHTDIASIHKGEKGKPGELKGELINDETILGEIKKNTQEGIYGSITKQGLETLSGKMYPVALKNEIVDGEAQLLCSIDEGNIQPFKVNIRKSSGWAWKKSRGIMISIIDSRLLEKTGGIVQGMSGSPIIQNGKMIGALTHVLVNEPKSGYGTLIENMIVHAIP